MQSKYYTQKYMTIHTLTLEYFFSIEKYVGNETC